MSLQNRGAVLMALIAAIATIAPAKAGAQRFRHRHRLNNQQYFTPPGSNIRIYGAPRQGYRFGGATIYPAPGTTIWGYGPPTGYYWPYGYPRGYAFPFGAFRQRQGIRR